MASARSVYRCTDCGAEQPKWGGRCEACGAWNTLVEEPVERGRIAGSSDSRMALSAHPPIRLSAVGGGKVERWRTGLPEFDFVLGGGIGPGSVGLVGREPGIRKSTLSLQCAARLEQAGIPTLYVSGEESPDQVRPRPDRPPADPAQVPVLGETPLEAGRPPARAPGSPGGVGGSRQTTSPHRRGGG